ncbi:MAG: hypothetical protein IPK07_08460 [Deltaproteobacteria bacterium]|nr:hypothetical protein [Deltaproteobacteria bacterium]
MSGGARHGRANALAGRAARFGLGWLLDKLRWGPGILFVGIGGAFLSGAWLAGPERLVLAHSLERFTARGEGHASRPFWAFEVDIDRLHGGWNWPAVTSAELCTEVEVRGPATGAVHTVVCGARHARHAPWEIVETVSLAPDTPIAWRRDERGFPRYEVRFSPGAAAWLGERPAGFWPLVGQSDEARAAMPPPGTELDAFWLEVDRPLEWLVRWWPAEAAPRLVPMAFDPVDPQGALPASVVEDARALRPAWAMTAALGVFGLVTWFVGWGYAMGGAPRTRFLVAAIGPLLALPWWGSHFEPVLLWLEPRAGEVGADIARDITEGLRLPVEVRDPFAFARYDRLAFDASRSYYDPLGGRFGVARPEPPPADADAALGSAVAMVSTAMDAADDAALLPLLERLRQDELVDRGQLGLLYLDGARRVALDERRAPDVRWTAASFLWWLTVTPVEPRRGEPAFATRLALWKQLLDFPPDPAVVNMTRSMLERIEASPAS